MTSPRRSFGVAFTVLLSIVLSLSVLPADSARAADAVRRNSREAAPAAASDELPAALAGLDLQPRDILSQQEAKQVRGSWVLTVNTAYFATQLQGSAPFTLQLWTVGAGIAPGTPVYMRLIIRN